MPDPLRWHEIPLQGLNLVEASAGTGKTHAIGRLYLRLVLERECAVEQLLVLTFTNAATAELRARIHALLTQAQAVFAGAEDGGPEREELADLALLRRRIADRARAARLLARAVYAFDEAAIFTIHGFCNRVLEEHAFACGEAFAVELQEPAPYLRELVEDFWRREVCPAHPWFAEYLLAQRYDFGPAGLQRWLAAVLARPRARLAGGEPAPEAPGRVGAAERRFTAAWRALRRELGGDGDRRRKRVLRLLDAEGVLNRKLYRAPGQWLEYLDRILDRQHPSPVALADFSRLFRLTPAGLAAGTRKGREPPRDGFFERCGELHAALGALQELYRQRLRRLRLRLAEEARADLGARMRRRGAMSYDDLLLRLWQALSGARGEGLARTLGERYTAALIDEFQDTDPLQYEILRRIYRGRKSHPVFLVGDPKQAIYGFRGADVFAYLRARQDADRGYTLEENRRSVPGLIRAVNALFSGCERPFVLEQIAFRELRPGAGGPGGELRLQGRSAAPCTLWWFAGGEDGRARNAAAAGELAARACAAEIARLLALGREGEALLEGRPLQGRDLAVLVRSHRQARLVQRALREQGVFSVLYSQESVLHTDTAEELQQVLEAVARPEREQRVRSALATRLLGGRAFPLESDAADERRGRFYHWHAQWRQRGFMPMFRQLLREAGVPRRLLQAEDGERRLTDLLHLAELLHAETARRRLPMSQAVQYLAARRERPSEDRRDEERLRLESDETLVRVATVHGSKGLEYPVVFCPFSWQSAPRPREGGAEPAYCHEGGPDYRGTLYLEPGDAPPGRLQEESLAEGLRLLYVALTRAQYCCYLVWGAARAAAAAPLTWLLWPPAPGTSAAAFQNGALQRLERMTPRDIEDGLRRLAGRAAGSLRVAPLPAAHAPRQAVPAAAGMPPLAAREFRGRIFPPREVTSFSALAWRGNAELPDYDAAFGQAADGAGPPSAEKAAPEDIHAFPRGARAGRCLHAVFERLDFDYRPAQVLADTVAAALAEYGYAARWAPVVGAAVKRVLATPLAPGLRLRGIPRQRRLDELEFYYPLPELAADGLRELLLAHGMGDAPAMREALGRLRFERVRGYMKGYIDLVFEADGRYYLADYKSNWLGPSPDAYAPERLAAVMARESYFLQYLVYTLALHRYLRLRLPGYDYERHMGGAFYLFLRGMAPERGASCGVFHTLPAPALIEALDRHLEPGRA
ncbi:MAG: exodeoxyribonuclease V subunit beta [Gammaproteobacteria bacterium]|nr:exodeoxyribonuclease V subunit beta [Gammaproteobacteria bacterium]